MTSGLSHAQWRWRIVAFASIALIGLAADLITKQWAFDTYFDPEMRGSRAVWWIDGVLGIETSTNGGALFGMGQGKSHWFAALSTVALMGIFYWLFIRRAAISWVLTVSLAMISGGILGNLYDRLGFGARAEYPAEITYHVRDWIHFRLAGVPLFDPWPNFNIADSLLVCGAILLVLFAVFAKDPTDTTANDHAPSAG